MFIVKFPVIVVVYVAGTSLVSKDEYNENWSQNAADHSKHDELERCPRSRTDVRPTDRVATDATDCSMLNFNRRRATVMTHTRAVNQGQLVQKIE